MQLCFGGNVLVTNDERRIFRRMAIEAPVTVTLGDTKLQGTCKDLSSTGMSIQLVGPNLNPGDQIQVLLATQDSRFPPLDVEAKVLRVQEQSGGYIVATEFLTMK